MAEGAAFIELAPGVTAVDVADACRHAALAFLRGVASGWSKRELAEWLLGPYEAATVVGAPPSVPPSIAPPSMDAAAADRVLRLLTVTRGEARACVHDFAIGREAPHLDEAFAKESIAAAWTQPAEGEVDLDAEDDTRASVFVPVNRPGLALGVRVRSLFVVDFLIRPEDYEGDLRECRACGVVLLEPWSRSRRLCDLHVRDSGTVPKIDDDALLADLLPLSSRLSR